MNNSIHFIDSVQYSCVIDKDNIVLSKSLGNSLKASDNNKLVSYMIKGSNSKNTVWEMGVGTIITDKGLMVSRDRLISSSNGKSLNFKGYDCTFYIIPNAQNYNTGFNNVIVHHDSFSIDPVTSIHILDSNNDTVNINLPSASNSESVVIEIKNIQDSCVAYILSENNVVDFLSMNKSYTKIVSDGSNWLVLVDSSDVSQQDAGVSIQSESVGSAGSLQYSDGAGSFLASDIYYDAAKDNLLLGNSNESNAYSVISTTGNNTVFNKTYTHADFIVYGSGQKNIYWAGDFGRFGVNIAPDSKPSTPFHLINLENCTEGIRVENRNSNTTANLSLYHRPSVLPSTGTICSTINFNARDSVSSTAQLAQIKSVVLDNTQFTTSGQLVFSVGKSGNLVDRVFLEHDSFDVALDNTSLMMSNTGVLINAPLVSITGSVTMPKLVMDAGIISFTGVPSDCIYDYGPPPTLTPTPTPSPTPINVCPIDDGSGSGSGSGDSCELNTIVAAMYVDSNDKEYLQIQSALDIGEGTSARRTVYVQDSSAYEPENTEFLFPVIYSTSPLQVKLKPYTDVQPFAISGNWPYFTTEAAAQAHDPAATEIILEDSYYGDTYYMPDLGPGKIYRDGNYPSGDAPVATGATFTLNSQHHLLVNGRRVHQYTGDGDTNDINGYNLNFLGVFWKTINSDGDFDTNT